MGSWGTLLAGPAKDQVLADERSSLSARVFMSRRVVAWRVNPRNGSCLGRQHPRPRGAGHALWGWTIRPATSMKGGNGADRVLRHDVFTLVPLLTPLIVADHRRVSAWRSMFRPFIIFSVIPGWLVPSPARNTANPSDAPSLSPHFDAPHRE